MRDKLGTNAMVNSKLVHLMGQLLSASGSPEGEGEGAFLRDRGGRESQHASLMSALQQSFHMRSSSSMY